MDNDNRETCRIEPAGSGGGPPVQALLNLEISPRVTSIPHGFAGRLLADEPRSPRKALARQIGTVMELLSPRPDDDEFPVRDLLALARVGTRGGDLVETSSERALQCALMNLSDAIGESGALVTSGALPIVQAEEIQLVQLFQNLIDNAIKYQDSGIPRIHIAAARDEENRWLFSVTDNGLGIDPQYFDRIFGIFQRLHKREEFSGTGIGLAICKRIVERHGGTITVGSVPGAGTTFSFDLAESQRS